MQFKASTDYGLRAVLYLAERGATCSSRGIAEDMSIPRDYLIQLAQLLRNAGIVEARPGKHGGYCLARDPQDITVLDVLDALGDEQNSAARDRCIERQRGAMDPDVKRAHELVHDRFREFFGSLTLADLLKQAKER